MKVILVDDDKLVLRALKTILEDSNFEVIAMISNPLEAVDTIIKRKADIILMDIRMPEKTGIDIAREILDFDKSYKILLLTTFNDENFVQEAISLGVRGYILKDKIENIIISLRAVMAGSVVFDEDIIPKIKLQKIKKNIDTILSEKELELAKLVSKGMNNREIAESLHFSEGTVRNYISLILEKLELRDRTNLAIYYLNNLD